MKDFQLIQRMLLKIQVEEEILEYLNQLITKELMEIKEKLQLKK